MKEDELEVINLSPLLSVKIKKNELNLDLIYSGALKRFFEKDFLIPLKNIIKNEKMADYDKNVFSMFLPPIDSKAFSRVISNNFKKFISFYLPFTLFGPDAVTFAITNECPCRCVHCSAFRRKGKDMETETITNTIKDLLKIGTYDITFTGGEPTLRKDFSELISSVEKDKACSLMFTSGYFADKTSLKDLKESGLDGVFVSLDSPLAKKHNSFRGVKVFERAKEMIKISKSLDLLVGISTYATHTNIRNREILKMLKLGEHLGVNEIVVFDCVPTGKLIKKDDVMLTAAEHEYLVNLQKKVNRDKNSPRLTTMSFINFNNAGCFGGMSQIHITASGDVAPCDFTPLSFGNIQRQSIKEIWNKMRKHPEYRNWRNRCRMQSPDFRKKYINKIPDNANLPYPIDKLDS